MKLLEKLYTISSPSRLEDDMQKFLINHIKSLGIKIKLDDMGNIFVTKGRAKTYPCVVSHIDEVHDFKSKAFKVIKYENLIYGYDMLLKGFKGIGADDKNGIWVCLKCLEAFDVLKCAFFVQEEIGCIGSFNSKLDFFNNCRFVLQCDRKGGSDFINRINNLSLSSEEFINSIDLKKYGYKLTDGCLTDVYALKSNGLKISVCNISCGYYQPHMDEEYTKFNELENCLELVKHIIVNCKKVYKHTTQRGYSIGRCARNTLRDEIYGFNYYDNSPFSQIDDVLLYEELSNYKAYHPDLTYEEFEAYMNENYWGVSKREYDSLWELLNEE